MLKSNKCEKYEKAFNELSEQVKDLYSYIENELYHYFEDNEKFVVDEYKADILNIIDRIKK